MSFIQNTTRQVTDALSIVFDRARNPADRHIDRSVFMELIDAVFSAKTEMKQLNTARALLQTYHQADAAAREAFFQILATDMDLSTDALDSALQSFARTGDIQDYGALQAATQPKRMALLRILGNLRGGAKCLVKIREDLGALRSDDPAFRRLDHDIHGLLKAWFNRGFLTLQPINWQTPAHILEKIIAYEAVHAIRDWDDLRGRLMPVDRKCFAFFHPRMPDDPVIFVEVALTDHIPSSIDAVLNLDRPIPDMSQVNTAAFYSISNCHAGLAGISFGNALIKQVARELAIEFPQLKNFVTLSPVPGLRKWAEKNELPDDETPNLEIAARYFLDDTDLTRGPRDPVARFHLGNGAILHAIHEDANRSDDGIRQSYGMMVNYLYDLPRVEERAESFAETGQIIASDRVRAILGRSMGSRLSFRRNRAS